MKRKKGYVVKRLMTMALIAAMTVPTATASYAAENGTVTESGMYVPEATESTDVIVETETETEKVLPAVETEVTAETEVEAERETETEAGEEKAIETDSAKPSESETEQETESEISESVEFETAAETAEIETVETEKVLLDAEDENKPSAIKNFKITPGNGKVVLTWDASDKATGYSIFSYDVALKKATHLGSTDKTTYTIEGLTNGTAYSYKIYAYNHRVKPVAYSDWSEVLTAVPGTPSDIKNFRIASGNGKLTLSWDASTDATGYSLFSYNLETKKATHLVSTDKTTYTFENLTNGTAYSYKIYAYNRRVKPVLYGNWSKVLTAVPGKPSDVKNLKIAAGNGSAVLTWSASDLATGYSIFRYDPDTKKATHLGSTNQRKYTVEGLANGNIYYFKIYAYNRSVRPVMYGNWSNIVSVMPGKPGDITNLKAEAGNGEIRLTWSKASLAINYAVYRFDEKSKQWVWIKNVSGTAFIDTGLKNGTTYKYRVKARNNINGKLIYGNLCSAVSVTPKVITNGWSGFGTNRYYYKDGVPLKKMQKVNGKYYFFDAKTGVMKTGWIYYGGYKFYFDKKTGVRSSDVSGLIGRQSSYVIRINKAKNTVTIYAKDGSNGYIIPVKAMICSVGTTEHETPTGTFYTKSKWRWQILMGPSWGQWVTQIYGGIYFHSVYYTKENNNNSLKTGAYNNLGRKASHGCVRLTAADAKWLYDNCVSGTKVVIYNDSSVSGPLGKPSAYKLESWHTWDPTDPNMAYKCKQRGCH